MSATRNGEAAPSANLAAACRERSEAHARFHSVEGRPVSAGGKTALSRTKILVVTGGPCAGKTSAMARLRERLARAGIANVIAPEAATDLILAGVAPWTCPSMLDFQTKVIALQLEREARARGEAAAMGPGAVVLCDRGVCDSHAYLTDRDYAAALDANGLTEAEALARYDAVFHLESVALADEGAYTRANNAARFESASEAIAADGRTRDAWSAHPHLRVVANEKDFEGKARTLAGEIIGFAAFGKRPSDARGDGDG